jgi:putative peptidoglycan lipid II flippase
MGMKNGLLGRANKKVSIGGAALLLIATSMVGQLLGFLRIKLINGNFNAFGPHSTDAFFAAFKIPDFFFYTIAAGALGVAFMPVLADHLEKHDRKGVWELSTSLLNLLAVIMAFVGVIILIFAPQLIHIVAPSLEGQQLHDAVLIMRFIAFNPLLFTISGILTAVQQTFGRFFFYAIAPLTYNLSIIVSIYVFKHNIGLVGLGIGAFIGACLQLMIAIIGVLDLNFHYTHKILYKSHDFRKILRQLPPRSIDQGMDSINSIVETNFSSRLGTSNITVYENAYALHTAPILLIGTAISTAAFPRLNELLAQGRKDLFRKEFLQVLRAMIWIAIPIVVICFFARAYFARMIFTQTAPRIAIVFGFLCSAIFFRIMYSIMSRYFYAQKDTWTPLIVSIFAIGLNVLLAWHLSRPNAYGVGGLAMAQSISAAIEVFILLGIMIWRDHRLLNKEFWSGVARIISVTGFIVFATYIMVTIFPLGARDRGIFTLGTKLALIGGVTLLVHVSLSSLFSLEEAIPVVAKVRRLTRLALKPVRIDW